GIACSPLVEGDKVFLIVGGEKGAGIVAFDKQTGRVSWKTSEMEASYSSPVPATFGSKQCVLFLTRGALLASAPADGKVVFEVPFRPPMQSSVTAASPVVIGDKIFI